MNNLKKDTILFQTTDSKCIDLGEEGILYSETQGDKHIVNITAMAVWDLIDGNRTVSEIVREVAKVCDVKAEEIEADIYRQLEMFKELRLVETKEANV